MRLRRGSFRVSITCEIDEHLHRPDWRALGPWKSVPSAIAGPCVAGRKAPYRTKPPSKPSMTARELVGPDHAGHLEEVNETRDNQRPTHDSLHELPVGEEPEDGGVGQIGPFVLGQVPRRDLDIRGRRHESSHLPTEVNGDD